MLSKPYLRYHIRCHTIWWSQIINPEPEVMFLWERTMVYWETMLWVLQLKIFATTSHQDFGIPDLFRENRQETSSTLQYFTIAIENPQECMYIYFQMEKIIYFRDFNSQCKFTLKCKKQTNFWWSLPTMQSSQNISHLQLVGFSHYHVGFPGEKTGETKKTFLFLLPPIHQCHPKVRNNMDELKPLEDRPVELRNVTDVKGDLDAFIHESQKTGLFWKHQHPEVEESYNTTICRMPLLGSTNKDEFVAYSRALCKMKRVHLSSLQPIQVYFDCDGEDELCTRCTNQDPCWVDCEGNCRSM